METALIIYGIGFVVLLIMLTCIEVWRPTGADGDCFFIMSLSSWIGVVIAFIFICIEIKNRRGNDDKHQTKKE